MANSKPGTYTQGGVRCTMGAPFKNAMGSKQGVGGGIYDQNKGPFDQKAPIGPNDISRKFFDGMSATKATTANAAMTGTAGAKVTAPVGQRRFKNPK